MKKWRNMLSTSLLITTRHPISDNDVRNAIQRHTLHTSFSGNHPDVILIGPKEGKVSISIEQVHELAALSWHAPVQHTQRVIVITPADALTLPAQQAVLKTIEEPPAHTQFLLLTHKPHRLLPTIHSRCQLILLEESQTSHKATTFVLPTTYAEGIRLADEWAKEKDTLKQRVEDLLVLPTLSQTQRKRVVTALSLLYQNVNAKLVVDELFFSLGTGQTK